MHAVLMTSDFIIIVTVAEVDDLVSTVDDSILGKSIV